MACCMYVYPFYVTNAFKIEQPSVAPDVLAVRPCEALHVHAGAVPRREIRPHPHRCQSYRQRCRRRQLPHSKHAMCDVDPIHSPLQGAQQTRTLCMTRRLDIHLSLDFAGTLTPNGLCSSRCSMSQMVGHWFVNAGVCTAKAYARCCRTGNIAPLCLCPERHCQHYEDSLSLYATARGTQSIASCSADPQRA